MGWYERVVTQGGKFQGRERSERVLLFNTSIIAVLAATVGVLTGGNRSQLDQVQSAVSLALSLVLFGMIVCGMSVTKRMVGAFIVYSSITFLVSEVHARVEGRTLWAFFVIVCDFALILRLERWATHAVVAFAVAGAVLFSLETWLRFGLLDVPGSLSQERRRELAVKHTSCDTLPCPREVGVVMWELVLTLFVVMYDFVVTRGFADEAAKEQAAMSRTIETVEDIAGLLANYDVDKVAEMLADASGQLPEAMHTALMRISKNLRTYRPYLPAALFEQLHKDSDSLIPPYIPPPALSTGEATVVFTDIRASTSSWEAAPDEMKKAIRTHNAVMRSTMALYDGYEVKTIGDSFMVAFEGACAGVNFGLTVHEALLRAEWPAGLLELPICAAVPGLWGGLTVRIGVNHGPVNVETNTITGRVDYLGHTVNVAARLESVCLPGAVSVPADLWSQVRRKCVPCVASDPTLHELKGVTERLFICQVWSDSLSGRLHHPLQDARALHGLANASSLSRVVDLRPHVSPSMTTSEATVSTLTLSLPEGDVANGISHGLEAVAPLLEQSGGTLLTLLGTHMWLAWNVGRVSRAHTESALWFAQRALRWEAVVTEALGLATGRVHHGDVGTTRQRFVTAAGDALEASLLVWRIARDTHCRCLVMPPPGFVSGALKSVLQPVALTAPEAEQLSPVYMLTNALDMTARPPAAQLNVGFPLHPHAVLG